MNDTNHNLIARARPADPTLARLAATAARPTIAVGRFAASARPLEHAARGVGAAQAKRIARIAILCAAAALGSCFACSAGGVRPAVAATIDQPDQEAVTSGQQALRRAQRFPWYDRSKDALRPIELPEPEELRPLERPVDTNWLRPVVWALLIVAAIGLLLATAIGLSKRRWSNNAAVKPARRGRVENLGFLEDNAPGDYLQLCLRESRAGRFERAIVYLYAHLLTELNDRQLVRLVRGKTNRQYLREVGDPAMRAAMEVIVEAFEDAYFGHHRIEPDRFEWCWQQWQSMKAMFEPEPAAVS